MSEFQVVLVTCQDAAEAESIANTLVEEKLAACVNIAPSVKSIYRWKGKIERASEAMLFIKTRSDLFEQLSARIKQKHSYSCPEIISLPITQGFGPYLEWLKESTQL